MIKIGYTHYWEIKKTPFFKSFSSALPDIEKVIEQHKDIIQYESGNPMPPLVTKNLIRFNGIGQDAYETFLFEFPVNPKTGNCASQSGYYFDFCKTAHRPYDIVVCKILLILKAYLGDDLTVNSDGFYNDTKNFYGMWEAAICEVKNMGYKIETKSSPRIGTQYFDCEITSINPPNN